MSHLRFRKDLSFLLVRAWLVLVCVIGQHLGVQDTVLILALMRGIVRGGYGLICAAAEVWR